MGIKERPLKQANPNNPYIKAYVEAVERGRNSYHVFPIMGGRGWRIKQIGSDTEIRCVNRNEAIAKAVEQAKRNQTEAFIHKQNGRIELRYSYGQ
jgi:hypothetical protein